MGVITWGPWSGWGFYSLWVGNVEDSLIRDKTHFLVSIDSLNSENIIFSVHSHWSFQLVACFSVVGIDFKS